MTNIPVCAPPDPDTRAPGTTLPLGACDTHCHVFGPAERFPYALGRSYTPPDSPLEDLRRLHAALGIERAVMRLPSAPVDVVIPLLDRQAELVEAFS